MLLKRPIKFNSENGGEGTPKPAGFESLSEISVVEDAINNNGEGDKPAVVVDEAKPAVAEEGKEPVIVDDKKPDEAAPIIDKDGNQVDASGAVIKTKEELASEEVISEFKIPGVDDKSGSEGQEESDKARLAALAELEKEQSWTALAKIQGIEITENTLDAYEKGIKENFDKKIEEVKTSAVKEAKEKLLAEKPAEVMAIIEGLEQGFTIDQLLEPKREIEKLEALSNAELIAEDKRLLGWTEDLIEKHITALTEKDLLDVEAQPLRDILKVNKDTLAKKHLEQLTALKQSKQATEAKARQQESDEIKSTLVSMKTYMDVPITDKVVNHIQQKWNNGEYHEAFQDPKVVAEFLMYKEFGPQGLKAMENRAYQRGRDEKAKKLHNIPPVIDAGGKSKTQGTVKAEGNFAAL